MKNKQAKKTDSSGNILNRSNDGDYEGKGKRTKDGGGCLEGNKHPGRHEVTSESLRRDNSDSSKGSGRDELRDGISNDLVDRLIEGMPIENADDGNSCERENSYDPNGKFDLDKSLHREDSHPEGVNWSDDLSLLCRSFDSGSSEHSDDPQDDSIAEFIIKKKIYERNIAMIEKQIQTNKLNKLTRAREGLQGMIMLIKNRKLSLR
ncbi:hypothetical protein AK88_04405 [Plasmodium fragile]|uniref:Uncharacterized protein n=1 Tax=Plasmodium fragile TaxID=5857 RepID=A0A0D9QFU3_PLAFR|nr:uncharacterized protein AK88_04405 [Plasmodium fragile]KJP85930.1 hypothetical protein AK88_04405 [Plasmodium fragile]